MRVNPTYSFTGTEFKPVQTARVFLKPLEKKPVGPTPEELKTLAAAQHAVPGKRGNFRRMSVLDRIYSRRNSMVLFPVVSKNDKRRLLANMVLFYVTSVLHVVLVLAFMKEEADNAEQFTGKEP